MKNFKKFVANNQEALVAVAKTKAEKFHVFRNLSVTRGGVLIVNFLDKDKKVDSVLIQKSELANDKLYGQLVEGIRAQREANSAVEPLTQKLDLSGWYKKNGVKA